MSLRRSARTQNKSLLQNSSLGSSNNNENPVTKKRGRKSTGENVASAAIAKDGKTLEAKISSEKMPPPPITPNKRRKVVGKDDSKPPLSTPTRSAIGLTTSNSKNYSSGDVDDTSPPPPTRPVDLHHTNAILITPGGTQVAPSYSTFEQDSPSKPGASKPSTTNKSLLDEACAHLIKVDSKLEPVISKHRCHVFSPEGLVEAVDPFRSLVSGILAQQVSGAAANSIKKKFIALFPPEACPTGFPPPSLVSQSDIPTLRSAGLSQRKAEYVQGLAEKFAAGELTVKMLMEGTDEEVFEKLIAVRGLGAWSVEMFMFFGLKRMDIFSTGDLGVQRGMAAFVGRDVAKLKAKGKGGKWKYMSEEEMLEISRKFAPYRSLFMWYMWRIEDVDVDAIQDN